MVKGSILEKPELSPGVIEMSYYELKSRVEIAAIEIFGKNHKLGIGPLINWYMGDLPYNVESWTINEESNHVIIIKTKSMENSKVKDQIIKIINNSNDEYWDKSKNEMPEGNSEEDKLIDESNSKMADQIIELFN